MKDALAVLALIVIVFLVFNISSFKSSHGPPLGNAYPAGQGPIFERLNGAVVDKKGNEVKTDFSKKDHFIFYYSASWCPPCQRFTPLLSQFYRENSQKAKFECILVSNDRSAEDMYIYMKKMPFPAFDFNKRGIAVPYMAGGGIPYLALVNAQGKVLLQGNGSSEFLEAIKAELN